MLAAVSTLVFLAAAALATAVIAASLAKGLAAASSFRRQLALCEDVRFVTIRHERDGRARAVVTVRAARRPSRLVPAQSAQTRRRAAA
jgi:hypothetical protein